MNSGHNTVSKLPTDWTTKRQHRPYNSVKL